MKYPSNSGYRGGVRARQSSTSFRSSSSPSCSTSPRYYRVSRLLQYKIWYYIENVIFNSNKYDLRLDFVNSHLSFWRARRPSSTTGHTSASTPPKLTWVKPLGTSVMRKVSMGGTIMVENHTPARDIQDLGALRASLLAPPAVDCRSSYLAILSTGWHITLFPWLSWHQIKNCVLVSGAYTKTQLLFSCLHNVKCHPVHLVNRTLHCKFPL